MQKFGVHEERQGVDVELPKLNAKEVLIKNGAIGRNYIDVYHRTGVYPIPLPSGIGLEACGMVEETGSDVTLFKVGDRVAHSPTTIGSYSVKQIFPQVKLVSVPEGMTNEIAPVLLLKGITAAYLLHRTYPA